MVIVSYVYGLKSSGADLRTMVVNKFRNMAFLPTVADQDVYPRRSGKPNDEDYYELLLLYVEDSLYCSQNPQLIMDTLYLTYDMKDELVGPPMIYLGAEIKKYQVKSSKSHQRMSSKQYMNNSIKTKKKTVEG